MNSAKERASSSWGPRVGFLEKLAGRRESPGAGASLWDLEPTDDGAGLETKLGTIRGGLECPAQDSGAPQSHRQALNKGRPSQL